jgi:RNA polymerase sigma factor (sigma-70 family)
MNDSQTTAAVQHYLDDLAAVHGDIASEAMVRVLLARSVDRLHVLCASLLYKRYPRLTRGPLNLDSQELLGAVVERLIKAMREIKPKTVKQFFGLANKHMRWELNDLARRLDKEAPVQELRDSFAGPEEPASIVPQPTGVAQRILEAIDKLPEGEREVFSLIKIQGLTQACAADVLGIAVKTVQRRLVRAMAFLVEQLPEFQELPEQPSN